MATRSETFGCGQQETFGIPTQVTSLVTEDGSHPYSASLVLLVGYAAVATGRTCLGDHGPQPTNVAGQQVPRGT
jgi:hypothetical protein